jgi:hypothetical protein
MDIVSWLNRDILVALLGTKQPTQNSKYATMLTPIVSGLIGSYMLKMCKSILGNHQKTKQEVENAARKIQGIFDLFIMRSLQQKAAHAKVSRHDHLDCYFHIDF